MLKSWRNGYSKVEMNLRGLQNYAFLKYAPPGHFYSPIPDMGEVNAKTDTLFKRSLMELPGVDLNSIGQIELAEKFAAFYPELPFNEQQTQGQRYYFDNAFFSYADAVVLYSMMRLYKPKRIVEVGSGYSSGAMLDVADQYLKGSVDFTFIEPYQQDRLRGQLAQGDAQRCQIIEQPVQDVDSSIFRALEANDILFVDSSHVAKIGSDVLHLFFNVLPALKPGVIIHVHDILWPFEYPEIWLREGRAWNEAYLLRAFLQHNQSFEIMFFNSYMSHCHPEVLERTLPLMLKSSRFKETVASSSIWLRKLV